MNWLQQHPTTEKLSPSPSSWTGVLVRIWDTGVPRLRRWRVNRRAENRIRVLLRQFSLYVEAPDRGRASFAMWIANFTGSTITLDRLEIYQWKLGQRYLHEQSSYLRASGTALPHTLGEGQFSIALHSSDVRDIVQGVGAAQNTRSSPDARLEIRGECVFHLKRREIRVFFEFNQNQAPVAISTSILDHFTA